MGTFSRFAFLVTMLFVVSGCANSVTVGNGSPVSTVSLGSVEQPALAPEEPSVFSDTAVPSVFPDTTVDAVSEEPVSTMLSQADVLACSPEVLSGRVNKWIRPGANAYTGTLELALVYFSGVPDSVKAKLLRLVKENPPKRVSLKAGDRFCEMAYSARNYHHIWKNVMVAGDWTTSGEVPSGADVYSVTEDGLVYELIRPDVCANWAYRILRKTSVESAIPAVPSSAIAEEGGSSDSFKLRVRFWAWESITPGLQGKIRTVNSTESDSTYQFERSEEHTSELQSH